MGNDSVLYRNQYLKSPQRNNSWRVGLSFTQPVGKKVRLRVAYNWSTRYERSNRDTYELSSLASSDIYGELPSGYEAGYVDSLSNRSHSRTNGHDLNVGFNYSDDTWMVNVIIMGLLRKGEPLNGKWGNCMRIPLCILSTFSL